MSSWKATADSLSELLQAKGDNEEIFRLLEALNAFLYPVENLREQDIESLFGSILDHKGVSTGKLKVQVAQLTYSVLTYQKALKADSNIVARLLHYFLSSLATTDPPNELLYASAAILNLGVTHEDPDSLVGESKPLYKIALTSGYPVDTQRAGLHFLSVLCETSKLSKPVYLSLFNAVLPLISAHNAEVAKSSDPLLLDKLLLSRLRVLHSLLAHLPPVPSLPLLLSSLKANMAVGLPGQQNRTAAAMASIQPPLAIPPSQSPLHQPAGSSKPVHSVAGPQERRSQQGGAKGRSRNKPRKGKRGETDSKASSDESGRQSSDSESLSASETSLLQWSTRRSDGGTRQKGRSWQQGRKGTASSSESEISDGDAAAGSARIKSVWSKIRHEALSCLAVLFQVLDRHTSFSYWLSFLPDGPRPPNSPPLLLTCVLKDPVPKCRGAAISVLCSMLEGSKAYLAVADDKPPPSQAFTPYSVTIGGVVKELHRSILLALAAEPHPTTLTQIIKALGLVVANSPYHQLSEGYITRVTASLGRLSNHRDVNVQVACLTCYGAVISITPSHSEVEQWLSSAEDSPGTPWLFQHCISLLQIQSSLVLQTEALQVLAALSKFYFPQISGCWQHLKDFYLLHLASFPPRIQQHVLKMLEELCRVLALRPLADVSAFWEELLRGPLTAVLQGYSEHASLSSQACDILATMSPQTMADIKAPLRMLAITLPLGLSKDEDAPSVVTASAVRVLGVFVQFDTFQEDSHFFLDCHSAIAHCLSSSTMAVRVQASWALANSMDSLSVCQGLALQPTVLLSLCQAVQKTLQDGDKVKCNGVRAAGSLLKQLPEKDVCACEDLVNKISLQLAKCVNSGSMKSRWNACYACHSAFSNTMFTSKFSPVTAQLLSALCTAVQHCKNFKVRNNAALALSTAAASGAIAGTSPQMSELWQAMLQALEDSEPLVDFAEFKHAATLKKQLCTGICHLAVALPCNGVPPPLLSGRLKESARKHMSQFLSQVTQQDGTEGEGEALTQERKASRELIERSRHHLESIADKKLENSGLWDLLDLFKAAAEERKDDVKEC